MSNFTKFLLLFFILSLSIPMAINYGSFEFGQEDYWDRHGVFLLFFLGLFPRLTLLFSSIASGGFLWWLGWLFAPRFLVALLATLSYWDKNPILVVFSWLFALSGESGEKIVITRNVKVRRSPPRDFSYQKDTIEADFRELKDD